MTLANMPKYDCYKDSGVEWLGEIPDDWQIMPIRAIFDERNEKNIGPKTDHILSVTKDRGVIPYDEKGAIGNNKSEDIERYKVVYPNDLVINKMNVVIGSLGLSNYHGALSQVYIVLKPRISKFHINFYAYLFHNETFYKSLIKYCTGIMELRESLDKDLFKQIYLPFPSLQEQQAISNFLDQKTAQIDQAVAIKEKQIVLLKERKQILIQNAVTQGLNPNAPMKDSGIDWIGQIPQHWEVKRLRHLGFTQNGISAGAEYFGSGFPFVSYGDVYNNRQLPELVTGLANSSKAEQSQYSIKEGDVLFTRTSETIEEIGFASVCFKTIQQATFAGFLIRFRPTTNKLLSGFSKYYFNAPMMRKYFVKEMNLVTRASLNQELLKDLLVLLPPNQEQLEIFEYIETQSQKIDQAIALQQQQIDKLKEYKTTLINSAVTGKIKITSEMISQEISDGI